MVRRGAGTAFAAGIANAAYTTACLAAVVVGASCKRP